jgi:hypothetical protein
MTRLESELSLRLLVKDDLALRRNDGRYFLTEKGRNLWQSQSLINSNCSTNSASLKSTCRTERRTPRSAASVKPMQIGDQSLPDSEDVGDVSDHILRAAGVRGI